MIKLKKTVRSLFFTAVAIPFFSGCALGDAFADLGKATLSATGLDGVAGAISKFAEDINTEDAYYIGRSVAANLLTNYGVYENKKIETYINKICQALVVNSSDPYLYNGYHVKILDSASEVNAYSTPGGHILLTRGLLDCAETEDALAAVIAHEIAHIQLRHGLNSIKASRFKDLVNSVDKVLSDDSMEEVSDDILDSMVSSGFSQGQEYDADEKAVELMAATGYQPSAMISMLEKMKTYETTSANRGFFKTHPSPSSRIYNVKSFVKKYEKNLDNTMSYRENRYTQSME